MTLTVLLLILLRPVLAASGRGQRTSVRMVRPRRSVRFSLVSRVNRRVTRKQMITLLPVMMVPVVHVALVTVVVSSNRRNLVLRALVRSVSVGRNRPRNRRFGNRVVRVTRVARLPRRSVSRRLILVVVNIRCVRLARATPRAPQVVT